MDSMGAKIRRMRRRLGFTLDELAAKTGISKPYLSLIETGRVNNPPSDDKLRKLEEVLGFPASELVTEAHLQRTPRDVRAMLHQLLAESGKAKGGSAPVNGSTKPANGAAQLKPGFAGGINLDAAYLSGVLQQFVEQSSPNVERVSTNSVPVINKVSAGYPKDFTDMSYPKGVADDYVGCPDLQDRDAFAARVHGDSMTPKYREGDIVIFSPAAVIKSGDDCFVRFEDGTTTFKRAFFEKDEAGAEVLRLQPRNERYRPKVVAREEVAGMYKAVYRYQRVDLAEEE
ncbi:MAG: XRE family transcriptional regulator [Phycisphaerae bacterium]|nr:XRE family transcriptional regulator [Tepidisphaeraceae bacterium]